VHVALPDGRALRAIQHECRGDQQREGYGDERETERLSPTRAW
jgi:hypothetical protein